MLMFASGPCGAADALYYVWGCDLGDSWTTT